MGDMEMIFPDGSGIEFIESGVSPELYDYCDNCGKSTNMRDLIRVPDDIEVLFWMCKTCYKKVK